VNRETFIAALVAAALSASADATPFGPNHGFDAVYAAVESAPEAPLNEHPSWLADLFEHPINPDSSADDERFVPHEPRPPASGEKSPETSQPLNRKE
jgi:hypothetical protein